MSAKVLDCLRDSPADAELFWELCEFAVLEEDTPDWFALESGEPLQVVGRDACGGRFCLVPASRNHAGRLLYVDSEGQAGIIADSLSMGIQMMIAFPYWRDCLKFSGGGNIEEMRKAQTRLESDLRRRRPDIEDARCELYRAFGLAAPSSPLETLHRVVSESANTKVVAASDRWPFEPLFNTFVVDDNPTWKQQS